MLIEESEEEKVGFKLGCEKDNDDKDKKKVNKGDAYKMDIDNGITKIKIWAMIRDGKKKSCEAKRWLEWWWRCRETRDWSKKMGEKRENDEREKVETDRKFTMDKWKEKKGGIKTKRNIYKR